MLNEIITFIKETSVKIISTPEITAVNITKDEYQFTFAKSNVQRHHSRDDQRIVVRRKKRMKTK